MSDLLERFEIHFALGRSSPGFHFSNEDMAEIVMALRAMAAQQRVQDKHDLQGKQGRAEDLKPGNWPKPSQTGGP